MPKITWELEVSDPSLTGLTSLTAAVDRLRTATQQAAREMEGITGRGRVESGLRSMQTEFTAVNSRVRESQSVFTSWGRHVTAIIAGITGANLLQGLGAQILNLGQHSLTLVGNLESNTSALEAFTGSAGAAQQQLAEFNQFAAKTSFRQDDVVRYAVQLEGVGIAGAKVVPTLRTIADALAGVGRGADQQKLQQVADAYLKIQTQGRAQADELLSFAESGIPIYDLLAQALGKSTAEITRLAEAGQLTATVFDQAFDVGVQQRWQGAAERSSQTLQGIVSNAQDVGDQFLTILGTAAVESSGLEQRLQGVVTYLNDPGARAAVEHIGTELGAAAGYAFDLVGAFGQLLGLPPLTIPPPPDFSQAAAGTGAIQTNLLGSVTAARDFAGEVAGLQARVGNIRDQQAAIDASYQSQLTAIRGQQAAYDASMDNRLAGLRDQARLLDQAYQSEKARRDLANLGKDIAKDRLLAVDVVSAQGQAAAARLKDELARQADLQGAYGHDQAKAGLANQEATLQNQKRLVDQQYQAQIRGIESAKQAQDQYFASLARGYQRQIDSVQQAKKDQAAADTARQAALDVWTQNVAAATYEYSTNARAASQGIADGDGVQGPQQALWDKLFGTPADQQAQGTSLAARFSDGVVAALPTIAGAGAQMGAALLRGLDEAVFGAKGKAADDSIFAIFGAISKGDWQGAYNEWAKAKSRDNGTGNPWISRGDLNSVGLGGLALGNDADVPMTRTGYNTYQPTSPPPGETWSTGHYDHSGGKWVWIKNDPTHSGTTSTPYTSTYNGTYSPNYTLPPAGPQSTNVHVTVGFDPNGLPQVIDTKINKTVTGKRVAQVLGDYYSSTG